MQRDEPPPPGTGPLGQAANAKAAAWTAAEPGRPDFFASSRKRVAPHPQGRPVSVGNRLANVEGTHQVGLARAPVGKRTQGLALFCDKLCKLKTDKNIIADLPDKTEVKAFCHLTRKQAALYQTAVAEFG